MGYERELQAAQDAADRAGRAVMEHYARFVAIPDAPASISTEADRQAQRIILDAVHRAFPADALCAEEAAALLEGVPQTGHRVWIVDPIDGSRGFAVKNGEFSVMIAFMEGGRLMLGLVAEPAPGRLTYAVRGGGCWRRDGRATEPVRCRVSSSSDLSQATLILSHLKGKPSARVKALGPARVVETYSAGIKLARVARGEADLYLNDYPATFDWDAAPGHMLVEEAGGRVTGLGGQEFRYGTPGFAQHAGMLATNGVLHAAAVRALEGLTSLG